MCGGMVRGNVCLLLFSQVSLHFWGKWATNNITLFPGNICLIVLHTLKKHYTESPGFMALYLASLSPCLSSLSLKFLDARDPEATDPVSVTL